MSPDRSAVLLAVLLAASVLAGCSSKPPSPALPGDAGDTGAGPAGEGGKAFATLHYGGAAAAVHEVVWANGTVSPQDTCNLGGCVFDTSRAFRRTDLAGVLPVGVPALVTVTLDWHDNPIGFGGWDTYLDAPESMVYGRSASGRAGHLETQAVLRPSGPVAAVLATYGPGGDAPATAYTMRITVDVDPEAVLPGVPVSVPLEAGDTVRAASYGGGDAPFLLFGPDGARLGLFQGRHTLPGSAATGRYAVLLPTGGPSGNVSTDSGAEAMAAMGLRTEPGPASSAPANGPLDVSWDVPGWPVGVGLSAWTDDTLVVTPFGASSGLVARVEGPGGYVFDAGEVCGLCVTGGYGYESDSGVGDPAVLPGSYALHAESDASAGITVQPFAIYLDP